MCSLSDVTASRLNDYFMGSADKTASLSGQIVNLFFSDIGLLTQNETSQINSITLCAVHELQTSVCIRPTSAC